MLYLLMIDGVLYGYDRMDILRIDLLIHKPNDYSVFERFNEGARLLYREIELILD